MMFPYDSYLYFFDLLSLTIVLLPLHYLIRGEAGKKLLLTAAGVYLLFCIAPRLLVFYFGFWFFFTICVFLTIKKPNRPRLRGGARRLITLLP